MQTLAYGQEFLGGQIRRRIHFHFVRTQRSFALTLSRKRIKAFGDFRIQVSPLFHRRASRSASNMPLSILFSRRLGSLIPMTAKGAILMRLLAPQRCNR